MYAIVEAAGRQYQLEAGRFVDIDLVGIEPGQPYVFDRVLAIIDGKESQLGAPIIEGAKVTCKVLAHDKNKKIIVYKQRPKKGTRKKQGHRQGYTRVLIDTIEVNNKVLAEAKKAAKLPKKEAADKETNKPKSIKAKKDGDGTKAAKAKAESK